METKPALKSKTINFNAVILGVIAALAAFDVDVPDELYHAILAGVPLFNIILRFVTKGAITLTGKQANDYTGKAAFSVLLCLFLLSSMITGAGLTACSGHQSATQQISAQTKDPGLIALASFSDAQDAYIHAQELYLPYQQTLRQSRPDLDLQILNYFSSAERILTQWERYGDVPINDKVKFREYVRRITIQAAQMMEAK